MVGLFIKPLFEAMVEQNKSLQSGAAICMGKMVDSATEPPVAAFRSCALESNKLQNLAGQRSDVLENLSPIVRALVDALKDIQSQHMNLSFLASCSHGPSDAWNHPPYSEVGCHVMEHMGSWTTSSVHQRFDQ
ncbi:hypothetical protein F2Q68_00007979 [Brassica cretica]|uniref:TORTIFOLIA1/SINE1-2 N-terminal domain-containing protein n=1 Tax=Brassica cretica TaxID=69181 RepID=A0A8S9KU96_BRACR|nr:hypothetical protein F2Q68_00007979 [Brassica cretica]